MQINKGKLFTADTGKENTNQTHLKRTPPPNTKTPAVHPALKNHSFCSSYTTWDYCTCRSLDFSASGTTSRRVWTGCWFYFNATSPSHCSVTEPGPDRNPSAPAPFGTVHTHFILGRCWEAMFYFSCNLSVLPILFICFCWLRVKEHSK